MNKLLKILTYVPDVGAVVHVVIPIDVNVEYSWDWFPVGLVSLAQLWALDGTIGDTALKHDSWDENAENRKDASSNKRANSDLLNFAYALSCVLHQNKNIQNIFPS